MTDKRLIEEALPIREISTEAAREKSIRHGHISTLHVWFARRPLVASRGVVFASLVNNPASPEVRKQMLDFIKKFCTWEASNDFNLVNQARRFVIQHNGGPPRLLDCFAGGGTIPLEALRVGCEAHALELNPVAVIIELCTLVYPQKYGKPFEIQSTQSNLGGDKRQVVANRLAYDVRKWGNWVLERAYSEIGQFYPKGKDGGVPVAYLWARTAICPRPACKAQIPLLRTLWLSKREGDQAALEMVIHRETRRVTFRVVQGERAKTIPHEGTMKKGSARCPVCKEGVLKSPELRAQAQARQMGATMIAVVQTKPNSGGKKFRNINEDDIVIFEKAKGMLTRFNETHAPIDLPQEPIPTPAGIGNVSTANDAHPFFVHLQPVLYGLTTWGSLFDSRQALALLTFAKYVREAHTHILSETKDEEYTKAVTTYLAIAVDRLADYISTLTRWAGDFIAHTFGRQAIEWIWDYPELNPFSGATGDWGGAINWIAKVIEHVSGVNNTGLVQQGTATNLPYRNEFFDAIITDPPYYDNVPYADLGDFFYVWLKRTVGHLYSDLFRTPLSPRSLEIIQNSSLVRKFDKVQNVSGIKGREFFERQMTRALAEMNRVLKNNGVCAIVFAHKTITAWETLIAALLAAGFSVSSSWPLRTERPGRLRAIESAALASSVWLICRKREAQAPIGSWKSVQAELDARVKERLDYFLSQGIKGADALLSAIGPAVEVYGRYKKVEKVSGEAVTVTEFLDKVREVVARHALSRVLSEQELGTVDPATAFYVLWKWTFESAAEAVIPVEEPENDEEGQEEMPGKTAQGGKTLIPFDDALKLARSVGAEMELLLKMKLLKQEKEYVTMLSLMDRKDIHGLGEIARDGALPTLVDVIHKAVILWASQEHGKLNDYLQTSGAANNETFWRVAQALSNLLPLQSREKQLLDGLLAHAGGSFETRPIGTTTLDQFTKGEGQG